MEPITQTIMNTLAPFHNPDHGRNRYNTPWRPNANGGTLAVDLDPAYGLGIKWFDHKDNSTGNGWTLAKALGIAIGGKPVDDDTPFASLADYAHAHGVPEEVFTAALWSEETRYGNLVFAFKTKSGMRYRYADPASAKPKRKYDSIKGYTNCWYGLKRAVELATASSTSLVICNGEASTVAAQHHQIAACCVTGGEKSSFPGALLNELREAWGGPVVVAYDCDATGKKAAPALAKFLVEAGFDARAVDLQGTSGFDLADFCRLHNGTSREVLAGLKTVASAGEQPKPKPEYVVQQDWRSKGVTASQLYRAEFAPLYWTVENILPEGAALLAGKPKSRKSWAALGVAVACARGETALGKLSTRQGTVLYLDLESNQRRMRGRLFSMVGHQMRDLDNLHIYTDWPRGDEGLTALDEWMAAHPETVLIVIDVLADFRRPRDTKEDPYAYDRDTVKPINALAERHRVTILLVHHTRKMKADDVFDEISGSTGLPSAVATMWVLGRAPNGSDEMVLALRGRDLINDEPLSLEWDDYNNNFKIIGAAATANQGAERRAVLKILADNAEWTPQEIAVELRKTTNSIQMHLRALSAEGLIDRVGRGKYQQIATKSTQNAQFRQNGQNTQNDSVSDSVFLSDLSEARQNDLDLSEAINDHSVYSVSDSIETELPLEKPKSANEATPEGDPNNPNTLGMIERLRKLREGNTDGN